MTRVRTLAVLAALVVGVFAAMYVHPEVAKRTVIVQMANDI